MLQREHSAILSTCIKLPVVIKIFVLSIFEWPLYTGFIVVNAWLDNSRHCTSDLLFNLAIARLMLMDKSVLENNLKIVMHLFD